MTAEHDKAVEREWRDKLSRFRNDGSCEDEILGAFARLAAANQRIEDLEALHRVAGKQLIKAKAQIALLSPDTSHRVEE